MYTYLTTNFASEEHSVSSLAIQLTSRACGRD